MSKHEQLRHYILESQRHNPIEAFRCHPEQLARQFTLPENHVREILAEMARDGLISLAAWDGHRERMVQDWPDANAFFDSTLDNGTVRIRVLAHGAELLAELPKAKLGFC